MNQILFRKCHNLRHSNRYKYTYLRIITERLITLRVYPLQEGIILRKRMGFIVETTLNLLKTYLE